MKIKKILTFEYQYGQEKKIQRMLYQSKEPILLKIKDFTDEFSLDYFTNLIRGHTTYDTFENGYFVSHQSGDFKTILSHIKENKPYRIFGQYLHSYHSAEIEKHVPLWQTIPFRPRFFHKKIKTLYFFGGAGSITDIHYDREQCCNMHLCLNGKKQLLLFTEDQSDYLYKLPFFGDSLMSFSDSLDQLEQKFPRFKHAEGYSVTLEKGDLLFMPKNCWHFTKYLDASAAATYVFYPKKRHQLYGYFTGFFYIGYKEHTSFKVGHWPIFKKFTRHYALASGKTKSFYKCIELVLFMLMLLPLSLLTRIDLKLRPRRIH